VLRTEFLFLGRAAAPGEEEQYAAYRAIADALGSRPLVIRTLDIGGDKSLPYVEIGAEANPFLGWRGIRVTLGRRDLLKAQLRAILRAGAGRNVEVLFPMVSSLSELREAKAVLAEVAGGKDVKAGVMIEVPAAVAIADQLAREAGFFSIGTNDLVQYAMAADRTNERVAAIADPYQPAVLRMIGQAIQAGRQAGIGVTLCGELAADPLATALLIGLGLEEFSVSAPLIPALKQAIARTSAAEAEGMARAALAMDSSESVRRLLAGGR
jgi:phosphocarrier protein FPr